MKRFNQIYRNELDGDGGDLGGGDSGASDDAGAGASGEAGASDDGSDGSSTPANYFGEAMPATWRNDLLSKAGYAEGDDFDKALKQLDRHADIGSVIKSGFEAQSKIRSGEISNGLPEDPSDDQVAAYREANGVPATAEDYELALDDGLVLGEADEAIMGGIYEIAHADNISSETMSKMTNAMLLGRQAEEDARTSQDGVDKQMTNQQLKEAWGGDTDTNVNMVKGLVSQLPESVREAFSNARLPDGKAIFNSPEVMVAMAEWARKINPSATVVPNSANPMQTMNDEIKKLEGMMGSPEWHKDTDSQKRYMDLLNARDGMQ